MTKLTIDLLYFGVREGENASILFLWYDLTGIVNDGSPLKEEPQRQQFYGNKKKGQRAAANIAMASPGQIYSFEKSEAGVYGSTRRYVEGWSCQEDVVKWQAESNAIERTIQLAQQGKKEAKTHLDWNALEPFRQAYHHRLNYKQQQMLLAQVMQYITKYKPED